MRSAVAAGSYDMIEPCAAANCESNCGPTERRATANQPEQTARLSERTWSALRMAPNHLGIREIKNSKVSNLIVM